VYIWGQRYIDDLVLRERGAEKLYSLSDPNWGVVAVCNASGVVQERMKYDAFGKVTWLDAAFTAKPTSAYAWNRTFTGQVLDAETSLMLYRNRFYHTGLGRFVSRDPIGYDAGDKSLYRYVGNMPHRGFDPMGNQECSPQPASGPIIRRYILRCTMSGNLRNYQGKVGMNVPNLFNHPEIIMEMNRLHKLLVNNICDPANSGKGTFSYSPGEDRPYLSEGPIFGFNWLINNYTLKYEASVKKSATQKDCYNIMVDWKFEDNIALKPFQDLAKDAGGITPPIDYFEGLLYNLI
jgi:RHS repeat-associated protein